MVEQILPYFRDIFVACATWTQQLLDKIGGTGVVMAAFCVVLAISLLFLPMRGRMGATSFVSDYQTYKRHSDTKEYRQKHQQYHENMKK